MAAGVMRDWRRRTLIDSAGMELDRTLLVYRLPERRAARRSSRPGSPTRSVPRAPPPPSIAPRSSRPAASTSGCSPTGRTSTSSCGCARGRDPLPAGADARAIHEHSATLGSGSARKNYLMGFGRGYVLRKWSVLTPRRVGAVLARDGVLCVGQANRRPKPLRASGSGARVPQRRARRALPAGAAAGAIGSCDRDARPPRPAPGPAAHAGARPDRCARHARRLPSRRDERAIALVGGRDALARRRRAADRDRARTGIGRARARRRRRAGGARLRRPDDALRRTFRHRSRRPAGSPPPCGCSGARSAIAARDS